MSGTHPHQSDPHDHHNQDDVHEHDLGLQHDLGTLQRRGLGRRGVLGIFGGLGAASLMAACGNESSSSSSSTSSKAAASSAAGAPSKGGPPDGGMDGESNVEVAEGEIPEETAGPYPGDGTNGPDVLSQSGVVRKDITSSFGTASGVAEGVPLTLRFKVYDLTGDEIDIMAGAAVYAWHCDREGNYSMYDGDAANENYLRGVQAADKDGWLEFTTIFPACYAGRWPHVHFEVYESLKKATSASNKLRTSQLALPKEVCDKVYATEGYEQSVSNLSGVSLDGDGIFSDGYSLQMAKLTGSVDKGYVATLKVPI